MAQRIERFEVTTPAGTTKTAPLTTNLSFPDGVVERLELLVPPGPRGFAGFKIRHSSQVIIPRSGNNWIIADNYTFNWWLEGYPTGNKWSILTHNTDVFDHTFYLTFHVNETVKDIVARATPQPIAPFGFASHLP